jgi:hypothetical protein
VGWIVVVERLKVKIILKILERAVLGQGRVVDTCAAATTGFLAACKLATVVVLQAKCELRRSYIAVDTVSSRHRS